MTFKEFLQLDELVGHLGDTKQVQSLLGIQRAEKRLNMPAQKKGTTSVSRAMSAGKVKNPARPARLFSPTKPMTTPSVLDKVNSFS